MSYALNLEKISGEAYQLIHTLDRTFIGTADYMGLAYFWAYEYRYPMRDCTIDERRRVHHGFMEAGLALDGESEAHERIIDLVVDGELVKSMYLWDKFPCEA